MVTEMAGKEVVPEVEGEADIAVGTLDHMGTAFAHLHGVKAAAIEKEQALLSNFPPFFDGCQERVGKKSDLFGFVIFVLHIDDCHAREGGGFCTFF